MKVKIEILKSRDSRALARLLDQSQEGWLMPIRGGARQDARSVTVLFFDNAPAINLGAWLRGRLVGFLNVRPVLSPPSCAEFHILNVHPDYRGRGIGRSLMIRGVEEVSRLGFDAMTIYTWSSNREAIRLYHRLGFHTDHDAHAGMMGYLPLLLRDSHLRRFCRKTPWHQALLRCDTGSPGGFRRGGRRVYPYEFVSGEDRLAIEVDSLTGKIHQVRTDDWSIGFTTDRPRAAHGDSMRLIWDLRVRGKVEGGLLIVNETSPPFRVKTRERIHPIGPTRHESELRVPFKAPAHVIHTVRSTIYVGERPVSLTTGVEVLPAAEVTFRRDHVSLLAGRPSRERIIVRNHGTSKASLGLEFDGGRGVEIEPVRTRLELKPSEVRSEELIIRANAEGAKVLAVSLSQKRQGRNYRRERIHLPFVATRIGSRVVQVREDEAIAEGDSHRIVAHRRGGEIEFVHKDRDRVLARLRPAGIATPFHPADLGTERFEVLSSGEQGPGVLMLRCRPERVRGLFFDVAIDYGGGSALEVRFRIENHSGRRQRQRFRIEASPVWDGCELTFSSPRGPIRESRSAFHFKPAIEDLPDDLGGPSGGWSCWEREGFFGGFVWGADAEARPPQLEFDYDLRPEEEAWYGPVYLLGGMGDWRWVESFYARHVDPFPSEPRAWQRDEESGDSRHLSVDRIELATAPLLFAGNHGEGTLVLERFRKQPVSGRLRLNATRGWRVDPGAMKVDDLSLDSRLARPVTVERTRESGPRAGWITAEMETGDGCARRALPFLSLRGAGEVAESEDRVADRRVVKFDNGCLAFQVAPDFGGSVIAVERDGVNQLHTAFPRPRRLGFRDPWHGGILPYFMRDMLSWPSTLDEDCRCSSKSLRGGKLGPWRGVELAYRRRSGSLEGYLVTLAYLTLPESNVLACKVRVRNGGAWEGPVYFYLGCYAAPGGSPAHNRLYHPGREGYRRFEGRPVWIDLHSRWAAVENGRTGDAVHAVSAGGDLRLGAQGFPGEGLHLVLHKRTHLLPGESEEHLAYLVFSRPGEDLEVYRELTHLRELP